MDPPQRLDRLGRVRTHRHHQHRHRRGRPRPRLPGGGHLHHARLGPEHGGDPAVDRPRPHLEDHSPAVPAGRQHARPGHRRASGDRPQPQQHPLPGSARGPRAVAQHRPRQDVREGDQLPQCGQLRHRPHRPRRLQRRQPGRAASRLRQAHRQSGEGHPDPLRHRRRQGQHPVPVDRRGSDLGTCPRAAHRLHPAPRGLRPRRRLPVPGDQRHRRPLRRLQGRRVEAGHRHRHLDPHQPGSLHQRRQPVRLQRPDHRPAEPEHPDGVHPGQVVARLPPLPLHRRRRELDPRVGHGHELRAHPALRHRHLRRPLADLERLAVAARDGPQAGLDDGVRPDRPLRLRSLHVRNRRDDLRRQQPDRLGQRRHGTPVRAGPGTGGNRCPLCDQPAGRCSSPLLRPGRCRRLPAHGFPQGVEDVRQPDLPHNPGPGLRGAGAPHHCAGRQPHQRLDPALRHLHRQRRNLDAVGQ
ncbi:hypothetical protein STSP_69710 [Streptomyces jeddahensis]|uniref:Uncharacterized protein n=1 Tax=Streptomyces jeddahensis TaxID=1716141 RepID=A0A177HGI3_9ACTN|nr:hypothetical protein STSP_69710 [Streptomyces jeddahensis]